MPSGVTGMACVGAVMMIELAVSAMPSAMVVSNLRITRSFVLCFAFCFVFCCSKSSARRVGVLVVFNVSIRDEGLRSGYG